MTLDDEDLEEGSWQVVGEEDDSQVDSVGAPNQDAVSHHPRSTFGCRKGSRSPCRPA